MCNLSWTSHDSSLEKDNSLNHSCVSPKMGCLEYTYRVLLHQLLTTGSMPFTVLFCLSCIASYFLYICWTLTFEAVCLPLDIASPLLMIVFVPSLLPTIITRSLHSLSIITSLLTLAMLLHLCDVYIPLYLFLLLYIVSH